MATLKAQHLAKAYKSRQVVRDVSLSIESGQIIPDERLEADPAAELTVDEANQR